MQDLRLAIRTLRATPIVTAVAILSLALGIGANTAIFSLVNSLLLRSLPVSSPDRIFIVSNATSRNHWAWSYAVWDQIRRRPDLFDGSIAWFQTRFNLAPAGEAQFVDGAWASGTYFSTLGVPPLLGRTFTDADDVRGGGPDGAVAVISYGFWQRRFGGAANVVGKTVTLDTVPFTIVGVTPANFSGVEVGRASDIIVPIGDEPLVHGRETWLDRRGNAFLTVMARLKPAQTPDVAIASLRAVQRQIWDATIPTTMRPESRAKYLSQAFRLDPAATGDSILRDAYARPLVTVMAIVALVLVIACANVANLQLARGAARRHELSLRLALGASRGRLVRQLLAESVVLTAIGAALALLIAAWGSRLLVGQLSSVYASQVFLDLSVDSHVLLFTIAIAAGTVLLFGVAPAIRASSLAPMDAMKEHGRGTSSDARGRLASGLVVMQVAVSVMLLVAAGLFVRSFVLLMTRPAGFERDRALLVNLDSQRAPVAPDQRVVLYDRVRDAVRTVPGVSDAAVSMISPVAGQGFVFRADVPGGAPLPDNGHDANAFTNVISPGWFDTFGIPLLIGRDFSAADRTGTALVAIVNQTLAHQTLGDSNPIGRTLTMTIPGQSRSLQIVGVVADSVYMSLRESVPPTVYTPLAQFYLSPSNLASVSLNVRTAIAPPQSLTKSVSAAIVAVSPALSFTFQPLAGQLDASLVLERITAMLAGFFGALALLLAALGLYGVTSYAVNRRRTEIGIRMALGAAPGNVVRLVLSRVSTLITLGVLVGAGISMWASKFVAALLYGLEPRDPVTLVGATLTLAAVGAFAGWLPAWRASRIDPAEVLRES
jgi:putative ABC transport system permease protein